MTMLFEVLTSVFKVMIIFDLKTHFHRVPKCDVTNYKFVKLWDLVPFSSKASSEKGPCQKLLLNCNFQPKYKGRKFDTAPYKSL